MTTLPVAHDVTMSSPGVMGALHAGSRVVMCPNPAAEAAFLLIAQQGMTITGVVPPVALLWMQAVAKITHDICSLQVL